MTTRIALLRGINLGPHNKVPMARLRQIAEDLGFADPQTYVQSGNLVFETERDEDATVVAIEQALKDDLGFDIPVISRSGAEIVAIADSHPFADLGLEARMLHVAFLDRTPEQPISQVIDANVYAPDRFVGDDREIYLAYPGGSGRSRLNHALLEKKLGVSATLRNWRTVTQMAEMVRSRN